MQEAVVVRLCDVTDRFPPDGGVSPIGMGMGEVQIVPGSNRCASRCSKPPPRPNLVYAEHTIIPDAGKPQHIRRLPAVNRLLLRFANSSCAKNKTDEKVDPSAGPQHPAVTDRRALSC